MIWNFVFRHFSCHIAAQSVIYMCIACLYVQCMYVYMYMHVWMYVKCMYMYVYMYMYMYVCMHVCMNVCVGGVGEIPSQKGRQKNSELRYFVTLS